MLELILLLFIVVLCLIYMSAGRATIMILLGFLVILLLTKVTLNGEPLVARSKDARVRPQKEGLESSVGIGTEPDSEPSPSKKTESIAELPRQHAPLTSTAKDYYYGNYHTGETIDDKVTRISSEHSDKIHENLLRSVRSTKLTYLPYIAEELDAHENSVWWENNNELEHLM